MSLEGNLWEEIKDEGFSLDTLGAFGDSPTPTPDHEEPRGGPRPGMPQPKGAPAFQLNR